MSPECEGPGQTLGFRVSSVCCQVTESRAVGNIHVGAWDLLAFAWRSSPAMCPDCSLGGCDSSGDWGMNYGHRVFHALV